LSVVLLLAFIVTSQARMLPFKKQVKEMDAVTTLHPDVKFNQTVAQLVESKIRFLNALEDTMVRSKAHFFDGVESTFNDSVDQLMINRQRLKTAKQLVKMSVAPSMFKVAASWADLTDSVRESKKNLVAAIFNRWHALQANLKDKPKPVKTQPIDQTNLIFVPMGYGPISPFSTAGLYEIVDQETQ